MSRRLAAALLVPAALALVGCDAHATVDVTPDASVCVSADLYDSDDSFADRGLTCDMVREDLAENDGLDISIEEYETTGHPGCRIALTRDNALGTPFLTRTKDTFTLTLDPKTLGVASPDALDLLRTQASFTLDVSMPGDILAASGNAEIDGNRATYRSLADLSGTITVTGESSFKDSSAFARGLVTFLGLVALAAGLLLLLVRRSHRTPEARPGAESAPQSSPAAPEPAPARLTETPARAGSDDANPTVAPAPIPPLGHPDDAGVPVPKFEGDTTAPIVNTESPTVDVNADVPIAPIQVLDAPPADETEEGTPNE